MTPGTRGDGLRLQRSSSDVACMRTAATLPGVVVLAASPRNGLGTGLLVALAGTLAWRAPGSATTGVSQGTSVDGSYLLEDGDDPSKWVRVTTYGDYLPETGQAGVALADVYGAIGPSDVAASDASAGLVTTTAYTLKNVTANTITSVLLWLDNTAEGFARLTISSDNITYVAPTSAGDPNVLAWASIAAGASVNLWIKRTVGSSAASDPSVLNAIEFSWRALN